MQFIASYSSSDEEEGGSQSPNLETKKRHHDEKTTSSLLKRKAASSIRSTQVGLKKVKPPQSQPRQLKSTEEGKRPLSASTHIALPLPDAVKNMFSKSLPAERGVYVV